MKTSKVLGNKKAIRTKKVLIQKKEDYYDVQPVEPELSFGQMSKERVTVNFDEMYKDLHNEGYTFANIG